jgi:hypothetical protein
MDPIAIAVIFLGGVVCFFGYPLINSAIRVWGFVVGGIFLVILAIGLAHMPGSLTQITLQMGIVFVIGGVIGALAAGPLSAVIIFLSGMALGALIGSYAYPLVTRGQENTLLTVILALATGLLAVRFQEVVLIVTTAFVGAVMVIYGVRLVSNVDSLPLVIVFFLMVLFGAAAQYKSVHPESSLIR